MPSSPLFFWASLLLFLTVAALLVVWFRLSRQNKRQEKLLETIQQDDFEKMLRLTFENNENERRRIAREILDDVGARLQAIRNTIHTLAPDTVNQDKVELYQMLDLLTERVRSISWDLMPATLERFGLVSAVEELCKRASTATSVPITFRQEGSPLPLDIHQQILLYRTIQEGVGNAVKHAKAHAIEVGLHWSNGALQLTVQDDGIGFEYIPGQRFRFKPGLGLNIMESRAKLLHAQLSVKKNMPSGSILKLNLPVYVH